MYIITYRSNIMNYDDKVNIKTFNSELKCLKYKYLGELLFLQYELHRAWKNPPREYYSNSIKRKKVIQLSITLNYIIRILKSYPMKPIQNRYPDLNKIESTIKNTMMIIINRIKSK